MAKGLKDLDPSSGLSDDDLLLVNQGGIDHSATVGQVKEKALELGGTTGESLAYGNHLHDDRYLKSSGGEISGTVTVRDVLPDSASERSLGGVDVPFKSAFVESLSADSMSLKTDVTFHAGAATMKFNQDENSIDFVIN